MKLTERVDSQTVIQVSGMYESFSLYQCPSIETLTRLRLEENIGIIAVNMPLMRPLYGLLTPKVKSRWSLMAQGFRNRVYRNSNGSEIQLQSSMRSHSSKQGRDWGLKVPGSQTMRTIDLSLARTQQSNRSESPNTLFEDQKNTREVVRDLV